MSEPKKVSKPAFGKLEIIVLVCVVSFFAWVGIKNYNWDRPTHSTFACINTLRQIDAATHSFALEHHKTNGEAINFPTDLTPYIKLNSAGKIPGCPQGGSYSIKKVGDKPTCSLGTTVTPPHILQ